MLQKKYRLTKNKEFNQIFKRGASSYGPHLGLKFLPNNLEYSRFAFLVSKKVSKRAVVRNLLKRRLREIIRLDWLGLKGYDVVVVVLPKAVERNYEELKAEIADLFKRRKIA